MRARLEWLKTTGGISDHSEVASEWWANVRRTGLGVDLKYL